MTPAVIPDNPLAPVSGSERIVALDIIRALALFGVILMNLPSLAGNSYLPGHGVSANAWEAWGWGISKAFLAAKAMSNFSMLFAMGLFIQFDRAAARGMGRASFAFRRLGGLLIIGLAHNVLIFDKDILVTYALLGLLFAVLWGARTRTLVLVGIIGLVLGESLPLLIKAFHLDPRWATSAWVETNAAARHQIFGQTGTWLQAVSHRFAVMTHGSFGAFTLESLGYMLPMFMTGAVIWRSGLIQDSEAHLTTIRRIFHGSFWIGLLLNFAIRLPLGLIPTTWGKVAEGVPLILFKDIAVYSLALGYLMGMLLLLRKPAWKQRFAFIMPMGRMALTNYLIHSLLLSWVFYHHGLGLWGRTGFRAQFLLAAALFACACGWSHWWLSRFRFGPAEWLWRSMTYGTWQPFRREPPPRTVESASEMA